MMNIDATDIVLYLQEDPIYTRMFPEVVPVLPLRFDQNIRRAIVGCARFFTPQVFGCLSKIETACLQDERNRSQRGKR